MNLNYIDDRLRKQIEEMLDNLTVKDLLTLMRVMSLVAEQVSTYTNKMAHLSKLSHGEKGGVDSDLITTIVRTVLAETERKKREEEEIEEDLEAIQDLTEKLKIRKKAKEAELANVKKESKQSTQEKHINFNV